MRFFSCLTMVTLYLPLSVQADEPAAPCSSVAAPCPARTTPDHPNRDADVKRLSDLYAERDRLQREIEQLCDALATGEQFLVEVEMVEVDLTRLRDMGLPFNDVSKGLAAGEQAKELIAQLGALRKNGLCKSMMAPHLMVSSGREASIFVGTRLPIGAKADSTGEVEYLESGQRVEALVEPLGSDRVRLHLHAKLSTAGVNESSPKVNGQPAPSVEENSVTSPLEMPLGETWVLGGTQQRRIVAKRWAPGRGHCPISVWRVEPVCRCSILGAWTHLTNYGPLRSLSAMSQSSLRGTYTLAA